MDKQKALVICDVNQQAINCFQRDMEGFGTIEVASNGYEAVQSSVSVPGQLKHKDNEFDYILRTWS